MATNNRGRNSYSNDEAKVTFIPKQRNRCTTMVSDRTINNIKDGILHGLEYCNRRQSDLDMFVVIQGNKAIPNARSILMTGIDASMVTSSDGSLKFVTHTGHHCLHVMFIGGGSMWAIADQEPDDSYEVEGFTQITR